MLNGNAKDKQRNLDISVSSMTAFVIWKGNGRNGKKLFAFFGVLGAGERKTSLCKSCSVQKGFSV
jgi:hypothetical protein